MRLVPGGFGCCLGMLSAVLRVCVRLDTIQFVYCFSMLWRTVPYESCLTNSPDKPSPSSLSGNSLHIMTSYLMNHGVKHDIVLSYIDTGLWQEAMRCRRVALNMCSGNIPESYECTRENEMNGAAQDCVATNCFSVSFMYGKESLPLWSLTEACNAGVVLTTHCPKVRLSVRYC